MKRILRIGCSIIVGLLALFFVVIFIGASLNQRYNPEPTATTDFAIQASTLTPTASNTPTATFTPAATFTPRPTATPFSCDCGGDVYNCSDFSFSFPGQMCFDYCMDTVGFDIHGLDSDGDGNVCEQR